MIKPNWDIFKAKFNENPQQNFEWFCSLLFCKLYGKPYGISRYINQPGIETEPINYNEDVVGWQAKFFNSPLSRNKKKILSSIEKAKRDNPDITRILFFSNQDWGKKNGEESKVKKEVERRANELGIVIEYKTTSFFESPFVSIDNADIARHFFTNDQSIINAIQRQRKHTRNVLEIDTSIQFNGITIEIDRHSLVDEIISQASNLIIISGQAGVGKTVIVKKIFEQLVEKIPFYVFKAIEFDLRNINELIPECEISEFLGAHDNEEEKFIVIDSAERLVELKYSEPFRELLILLKQHKWNIIFTTRESYLEDLRFLLIDLFNTVPNRFQIGPLSRNELNKIFSDCLITLPQDEHLVDLLKIPFYLNEYLRFFNPQESLHFSQFKTKVWNLNIKKSKPKRENLFIELASKRADEGQFFIIPEVESDIYGEFVNDGILGFESSSYFITHDIYEEWALEKFIEREYLRATTHKDFFTNIGKSLPFRRSLRKWVSEKLMLDNDDIKLTITDSLEDESIEQFWKDELLVSVLLSDFSTNFFLLNNERLLGNEDLIRRISFLLRTACKTINEDASWIWINDDSSLLSLHYVFTKPYGKGWNEFIKLVYENFDNVGIQNIEFIMPVIYDWNNCIKKGKTTRFASLIALKYYQHFLEERGEITEKKKQEQIIETICSGAFEIKPELEKIFEEILKNKWKNYRDPYYQLSQSILSELFVFPVLEALPECVLKIANLFWIYTPIEDSPFGFYDKPIEIEQYFGLERDQDYFPASALQTPIYLLLKNSPIITLNFILEFTNYAVLKYIESKFDPSVITVPVLFGDCTNDQYLSNCLWNLYRGTGSPVSPCVLQSMHMALEKYLLEIGKILESETLESYLFYLLKQTKSASISAVVASIVLAFPEKTFNVARILFQTKEFILFDTTRLASEYTAKSQYSIVPNLNPNDKIFENERLDTFEDKHRKQALEHLFLNYQLQSSFHPNENKDAQRTEELWDILDNYYDQLPDVDKQNDQDKLWRLFLARMDLRKMSFEKEEIDQGVIIQPVPDLAPEIRDFQANGAEQRKNLERYTRLKNWSALKYWHDAKYKEYEEYENNPERALAEALAIFNKLNMKGDSNKNSPTSLEIDQTIEWFFKSIPSYVCAVVIRDHIEILSTDEKQKCKQILYLFSSMIFNKNYQFLNSDGVDAAVSILPKLLELFPEERERITKTLLFSLFLEYPAGGILIRFKFNRYPINAIRSLWFEKPTEVENILFCYLIVSQNLTKYLQETREKDYKKNVYGNSYFDYIEQYFRGNDGFINSVIQNVKKHTKKDIIAEQNLGYLFTAFQLIPGLVENCDIAQILKSIIIVFSEKLFFQNREDRVDYGISHGFLEAYAVFLLNLNPKEVKDFIDPFLEKFQSSEVFSELFQQLVFAENYQKSYYPFWSIWELFKNKVVELSNKEALNYYNEKIIKSYFFAHPLLSDDLKNWDSLKPENKSFFSELSKSIGASPAALYAISLLLFGKGSHYLDQGIFWISTIIANNPELAKLKLETNTIYYLENITRRYLLSNRDEVRRTKNKKEQILIILQFLIEKGSAVGYMVRENIL